MSFSLYVVIAESAMENQSGRQHLATCRKRHILQCTSRPGRSGCTPAKPYPPSCDANLARALNQSKQKQQQ